MTEVSGKQNEVRDNTVNEEASCVADFDKRHHEIQNLVNSVIYFAPKHDFTIEDLIYDLKRNLPKNISESDIFYATELLKGTVCRLVLIGTIRKINDKYYIFS